MAWAYHTYGQDYHWIIDLLTRMQLPVHSTLVDAVRTRTRNSQLARDKRKTDTYKQQRISRKQARAAVAEVRKKWTRDQKVKMFYGDTV